MNPKCRWCEQEVGGADRYHLVLVNAETGETKIYCSSGCVMSDLVSERTDEEAYFASMSIVAKGRL